MSTPVFTLLLPLHPSDHSSNITFSRKLSLFPQSHTFIHIFFHATGFNLQFCVCVITWFAPNWTMDLSHCFPTRKALPSPPHAQMTAILQSPPSVLLPTNLPSWTYFALVLGYFIKMVPAHIWWLSRTHIKRLSAYHCYILGFSLLFPPV